MSKLGEFYCQIKSANWAYKYCDKCYWYKGQYFCFCAKSNLNEISTMYINDNIIE